VIAAHVRWPLVVITVPTKHVASDFVRLAVERRCRTKTQFEVSFPMAYVLPRIKEAEVWTGWNADRHYGNSRECIFRQRRLMLAGESRAKRKQAFDDERRSHFKGALLDPESGLTWWYAQRLTQQHGKRLLDPYVDDAVYEYFLQFDHEHLSPLGKPLIRQALAERLRRLPKRMITVGVRLQSGAGVGSVFSALLQDKSINRFEKRYGTVSALCQRWGYEVSRDPEPFLAQLAHLPPQATAHSVLLEPPIYRPYLLADARPLAAHGCTAVEAFAGGAGSGLGLEQAGYRVVLANDFVAEAARTHRANLTAAAVNTCDIREITASRAAVEAFLQEGGVKPGKAGLLSGSFPCCEFGNLGGGLSDQSQLRAYSDTKQRGISTLIFNFVTLARMALPKTVVAENIPNLGSVYRDLLEAALDMLRFTSSGQRVYFAGYAVLSADDFGTPQARQRLFVIAVKWDVAEAVGIGTDTDVLRLFPEPTHLPVSVRSALEGLRQSEGQIRPWRTAMSASGRLRHLVRKLTPDPIDLLRPRHVGLSEKTWFSLVRCS
jgi:site-specific DNA-cytosine methylase